MGAFVRTVPSEGNVAAGSSDGDTEAIRIGYVAAIDGLRTVAVLAVIIFHLGIGLIPGGFVGVDIFFVISGFVVAGSVLTTRFNSFPAFLSFFYARRIRRIMPALLVCLFVTFILSALFVPTVWLSTTNEKVGRAAVFGFSNVLLAFNSDTYFSPRAELNPFIHTWSLGVEEQFYLIFPLFWCFWLLWGHNSVKRQRVVLAIGGISALSLICCAILSVTSPRFAFYMIYSRFWELGVGVVLASSVAIWRSWLQHRSAVVRQGFVGLAVIFMAASLFLADEAHFPFPWALMPVASTGMLICALVSWPKATVTRLLASIPMVYLGRRSYSLYLWHWPIFALMRWTVGFEEPTILLLALTLTMVAGCASYRFVEQPFRHTEAGGGLSSYRTIAVGLVCMLAAAGLFTGIMKAKPHLLLSVTRDTDTWMPDEPLAIAGGCRTTTTSRELGGGLVRRTEPTCRENTTTPTLFVFGDSHAAAYQPMLMAQAAQGRFSVEVFRQPLCSFFNLSIANADERTRCARFSLAAMQDVGAKAKPGDVLFLPSLRVERFGNQWGELQATTAKDTATQHRERERALVEAVDYFKPLVAKGVIVIVEGPKPVFKIPPFRCSDWFNASNPICADGPTVSRSELAQRSQGVRQTINELMGEVPGLTLWDPFPILCPGDVCSAYAGNGKPLVFDGDHLSRYANEVLRPSFEAALASTGSAQ